MSVLTTSRFGNQTGRSVSQPDRRSDHQLPARCRTRSGSARLRT